MTSDESGKATAPSLIRELRTGEGAKAAELAAQSPTAAHWNAADYEKAAVAGTDQLCLVAERAPGAICGFLHAFLAAGEAELLNLVVASSEQRRGIASALLEEASKRLKMQRVTAIWLEVRESNSAAIGFYRARGFDLRGRRKNYYHDPPEDARVYCRRV